MTMKMKGEKRRKMLGLEKKVRRLGAEIVGHGIRAVLHRRCRMWISPRFI
jgi:hypothetical protein